MQIGSMPQNMLSGQECPQPYMPLFVDVRDTRILVVGGGAVAQRKALMAAEYGADVTVVAPRATDKLADLAEGGQITWLARDFADGDVADTLLVFAATEDEQTNERVEAAARAAGALVNRVDVASPQALIPATLKRGNLQIAVSTTGCSPSLARSLRDEIDRHLDASWAGYVDLLGQLRALVMQREGDPARRKQLLETASNPRNRTQMMGYAREGLSAEQVLGELSRVVGESTDSPKKEGV